MVLSIFKGSDVRRWPMTLIALAAFVLFAYPIQEGTAIARKTFYELFEVENPKQVHVQSKQEYSEFNPAMVESIEKFDYRKHTTEELVALINTPEKAGAWCSEVLPRGRIYHTRRDLLVGPIIQIPKKINLDEIVNGPRFTKMIKGKDFDCGYAAVIAANLLRDDGFPPYALMLFNKGKGPDHIVFAYESGGLWGSVGGNEEVDNVPAIARSIDDLASTIGRRMKGEYTGVLVDLDKLFPDNYK